MNHSTPITLRDIAKALGVSHSAVSLALHDSPRISPELRRSVHETAQAMGYHPNPMAAALGQMRSESVRRQVSTELAWLNSWTPPQRLRSFKEFDLYWKGAFQAAEKYGYRLTEFICESPSSVNRLEKIFQARNIRGILIPPQASKVVDLASLPWHRFAAIRFGHSTKYPPVHLVAGDQLHNSMLAWDKIRACGYQHIGYVTSLVTERRTQFTAGFLMGQAEISPEQRLPILCLPSGEPTIDSLSILARWLDKYRPDALLTEIAALGKMLNKMGWKIPRDISLATLSTLDGDVDTGIDQNSEEIGATAVELVVSQINHNSYGIPPICKKTLVAGRWIGGKSLPLLRQQKKAAQAAIRNHTARSGAAFPFLPRTIQMPPEKNRLSYKL